MYRSINPANGEQMKYYLTLTKDELNSIIEMANNSYHAWKEHSIDERAKLFFNLAWLLEQNIDELAQLSTLEMGMLYKDAKLDIQKSSENIRYFAENAKNLLGNKPFSNGEIKGEIIYQPLGIIFCITPWNYPYNQVFRSAIPNIIAGNTILMKHSSIVPQVALKIQELFEKAGFQKGIFTNIFLSHQETEYLISHNFVKGVSFTGSEGVGKLIGQLAGKYAKPSILELGGSDAFVLLETNNIDKIIPIAIKGRFSNNGQKCNSSKRFIIHESIFNEFCNKFSNAVEQLKVGNPFDEMTQIGPLAQKELVEEIDKQVRETVKQGATILVGGKIIEGLGNYYSPTVLKNVKPGMKAFDEEVFGPVATLTVAKDLEEIIYLVNNSKYGLGCSIFGDNIEEKKYIAKKVEVANISIDKLVTSYAFLPYGGIKNSGYGKELGEEGIKYFTNQKIIISD